jgi:hypothetical protein
MTNNKITTIEDLTEML